MWIKVVIASRFDKQREVDKLLRRRARKQARLATLQRELARAAAHAPVHVRERMSKGVDELADEIEHIEHALSGLYRDWRSTLDTLASFDAK